LLGEEVIGLSADRERAAGGRFRGTLNLLSGLGRRRTARLVFALLVETSGQSQSHHERLAEHLEATRK